MSILEPTSVVVNVSSMPTSHSNAAVVVLTVVTEAINVQNSFTVHVKQ